MPLCRPVARAAVVRPPGLGNSTVREIGTFSAEMLITGKGKNTPRFPRLIVTIPPRIGAWPEWLPRGAGLKVISQETEQIAIFQPSDARPSDRPGRPAATRKMRSRCISGMTRFR